MEYDKSCQWRGTWEYITQKRLDNGALRYPLNWKLKDRVWRGSSEVLRKGRISSNLLWMSTKLLMLPPPVYPLFVFHFFSSPRTDSHPLTQHCLSSNLIYFTVIFVLLLFSPSVLPPGALHYPVCGPWQDPGPSPADSVPLGCLLFFCSQNRLNYSGGKTEKKDLMREYFILSGNLNLINQTAT